MKYKCTLLSLFFYLLFSNTSVFSSVANEHYMIFIDAGSSGSRLHLFQYKPDSNFFQIKEVFSESVKPGLSSFYNQPEKTPSSLQKMLVDAAQYLATQHIDQKVTPINIMGTAGMRLLPEDKQKAIYLSLKRYIQKNYHFPIHQVKTISGQDEGLYAWMDVNYLAGSFKTHNPTIGSIDMGGASTQIAYETESVDNDVNIMTINQKEYAVFSKSFLGMGQDQTFNKMLQNNDAGSCFPPNYKYDNQNEVGHFNLDACRASFSAIIQSNHVSEELKPMDNKSFIAFSGIYYVFNFFNSVNNPNQSVLEAHIQEGCSGDWEQLKKNNPQVPEKYLATYCANAVYQDELLFDTYKLRSSQLKVSTQINNTDLDWTLGAALYELTQFNTH